MRIVFLGAPGAGKGTQASIVSKNYDIPHISTGEIFRINIKNETPLGIEAKKYIDQGLLCPDSITEEMVKHRLEEKDCLNGFILDGFPRTIQQAEFLDHMLEEKDLLLDAAINISVTDQNIIERMSGRRMCPKCGLTYHVVYNPPLIQDECNNCKGKLIQREDDNEETVIRRLETYHIQTSPLMDYYRKKSILIDIAGEDSLHNTTIRVTEAVRDLLCTIK